MPTTEQVIVEFVPDFTQLTSAYQKLQANGLDGKTAKVFEDTTKAVDENAQSVSALKKQYDDLKNSAGKLGDSALVEFMKGVQDALDEAGVSMEEFIAALKKGIPPAVPAVKSLRAEFAAMKNEMEQLDKAGQKSSARYKELKEQSGQLAVIMKRTSANIKEGGTALNEMLGFAKGVAGGFEIAQGAAGLFGGKNKELEETLLKVNSAMAIMQGIASIANPFEAVITGISLVVSAFIAFTDETEKATNATDLFNESLKEQDTILTKSVDAIDYATKIKVEKLKQQGATAEQINNAELSSIIKLSFAYGRDLNTRIFGFNKLKELNGIAAQFQVDTEKQASDALRNIRRELVGEQDKDRKKGLQDVEAMLDNIVDAYDKRGKAQEAVQLKIQTNITARADKAREDEKKAEEAQAENLKKLREAMDKAEKEGLEDTIAGLQLKQKAVEKYSDAWFELNNQIIATQAELAGLGQSGNVLAKTWSDAHDKMNESYKTFAEANEKTYKEQREKNAKEDADKLEQLSKESDDISKEDTKRLQEKLKNQFDAADKQKKDAEEQKKQREKDFQEIAAGATQILSFYDDFAKAQAAAEQSRIESERKHVDELLQAGAITEKDAKQRLARLDAEEKKLKRQEAIREKEIALFNAIINGASAIAKAAGNPITLGIAIATVAAQLALIAAKPIPKFASGKKNRYEGIGITGEAGAELVQQGNRLMLVTKPTAVYLRPEDKVYTAAETRRVMQNIDSSLYKYSARNENIFDYEKLGQAILRNSKNVSININKDFIAESVADGLSYNKYFNKRYSSK